jgi:hypothetical protein
MKIRISTLRSFLREELNQMKLGVSEPTRGQMRTPYVPVFDEEPGEVEADLTFDEVEPEEWDGEIPVEFEEP